MERFREQSRIYRMKVPFCWFSRKVFPLKYLNKIQQVEEKLDFIVQALNGEFDVLPLWDPSDNVQNQPKQHPLGRTE